MLELGSIVAEKFRIERVLGSGGMGVVAVATNLQLDQRVVVKVLHDRFADDPDVVARFLREARAAAKLQSEHVCRVFDVISVPGRSPLIIMELLKGRDLATEIAHLPLAVPDAVDRVLQACVGIAEAHAHGIVHRDLKPANLFVTRRIDGSPLVKVLDFGIAKLTTRTRQLTNDDVVLGTPAYMSPEQLRSPRDVDARADQWALGVILYEAVSGKLPFSGPNLAEVAGSVARDAPTPLPGVDPEFAAVVMRCLDKQASQRYRDITALARALVPFGGPSAADSAALAAKLLGDNIGNDATLRPGAIEAVLAQQPTVSTEPPIPVAAAPVAAAPAVPEAATPVSLPPVPAPPKRPSIKKLVAKVAKVPRAGVIAAIVLGAGVVAATTAILLTRDNTPPPAPPAPVAPVAKAPPPTTKPAAKPTPTAPKATPTKTTATKTAATKTAAKTSKPPAQPLHGDDYYARIASSACARHDAPAARHAVQQIAAAKRKATLDRCRKLGTPL